MGEWFASLSSLETTLFVIAVVATFLFAVQLVMMFVGGDADTGDGDAGDLDVGGGDVDLDGPDIDADLDGSGAEPYAAHADTDVAFKLLTFQGVVAFFMMFGWVSLSLSRAQGFSGFIAIGGGVVAGALADLAVAKMMQWFGRLQSSGTMDLWNAVGQEGRVYLSIKADEPGQVQVAVQGHLKVFDAVSDDGSEIPTDTRVEVVRVVSGNTMVVRRT